MQREAKRVETALSTQSTPPSVADRQFYVSLGLIISVRLADVEEIRKEIELAGGKIMYQTVTPAPIYIFRHYEVERILSGDLSHLREIHDRKQQEKRRVEK